MKIFIRATSCISPQETFDHRFFSSAPKAYHNNFLKVVEPDYKSILDVKLLRRTSRIVRIGLAAAKACLAEGGEENVDAIVTGTAYGCLEDSENFLKAIVEQNEEMLSPTSFIQSTHNTVGAQIALFLKCHSYNNTFVHRGFSFEHALTDALLFLKENQVQNVLAGSDEEITAFTFSILKRFGLYKQSNISNLDLYQSNTRGSIAGEGSAFFLLCKAHTDNDYAKIDAIDTCYKSLGVPEIKKHIEQFLAPQQIATDDIDLVITGMNGDVKNDLLFKELKTDLFTKNAVISYKHLSGEYPTSSSFALWLAANIIKQKRLPECFEAECPGVNKFRRILIYNIYQGKYHSLILLSSCDT